MTGATHLKRFALVLGVQTILRALALQLNSAFLDWVASLIAYGGYVWLLSKGLERINPRFVRRLAIGVTGLTLYCIGHIAGTIVFAMFDIAEQVNLRMNNGLVILVIVIFVIGGAIVWVRYARSGTRGERLTSHDNSDFPPKPKWKPTVRVDISKIVKTFAYYTDHKRAFAVFTHGTCVVLPDGSKDEEKDAKEILDKIYRSHPDFNPQAMDDGNSLVGYSQPGYSVVFKEEFETNREYIEGNHLDGLVRAEVLLNAKGEPNKFDDIGKIGLFGRARMFLDAQEPAIVQIWRPHL
jgi:hypothetical protein